MSEFEYVTTQEAEQYAEEHSSGEDELLSQLRRKTHLQVLAPRMLSGALQGRFLQMISQMTLAQNILEIGTYTGYSAICMARGMQKGGKLITLEHNPELELIALEYFKKAGLDHCIELRIGEARDLLETMPEKEFDLIFLDADKENYPLYYSYMLEKLRKGGWGIVDNVLWSGKVWQEQQKDKVTLIMREFNDKLHADPRIEHLLLPFRDGISLFRKL